MGVRREAGVTRRRNDAKERRERTKRRRYGVCVNDPNLCTTLLMEEDAVRTRRRAFASLGARCPTEF